MLRDILYKTNRIPEYMEGLKKIFMSYSSIALFGAGIGG